MAPHPDGEAASYAVAFELCDRAFHQFDASRVKDDDARRWIATINALMNTDGVQDPTNEGTYIQRARAMALDEKLDFSRAVDELASWFEGEFWSDE